MTKLLCLILLVVMTFLNQTTKWRDTCVDIFVDVGDFGAANREKVLLVII